MTCPPSLLVTLTLFSTVVPVLVTVEKNWRFSFEPVKFATGDIVIVRDEVETAKLWDACAAAA